MNTPNEPQNPPWTPGPWEVFKGPDSIWWHVRAGGNGREIADTTVWNKPGEPGESEANARLIAAAPELVAALEALRGQVQFAMERGLVEMLGMDILRDSLDGADTLLARVRGEEKQG